MALSRVKTWIAGEVLSASDLNSEFNSILNNALSLISPLTGAVDFDGNTITLDAAAATQVVSSAAVSWNFTSGAKTGTPATTGSVANYSAQTFTDNATVGSGTAAAYTAFAIQRPTLVATNALVTTTDAATWYVPNSPLAGTNETITNSWAIWVDTGNVRFDDDIYWRSGTAFNGIFSHNISANRTWTFPDVTGTITTNGDNLSVFAATTSAQLAGVISDETGSGALVFANTPTLVTPILGAATGTSVTLTGAMSSATVAGAVVATQAEQETGSSTTVVITPARQQFHPSAAKFWVNFNGTGTPVILSSYNVAAIVDNGTGDYNITIDTDFSAANQCVVGMVGHSTAGDNQVQAEVGDISTGTIGIFTVQAGALADFANVMIVGFGDQ